MREFVRVLMYICTYVMELQGTHCFSFPVATDLQVCRSAGLQVCRSAELKICRSADLQTCGSADLQVCRFEDLKI